MSEPEFFRVCSTCKTPIPFESRYFSCSVSTCNRRPTALYFCSVPCWDAHVPDARHRDAWAEEERAPDRLTFLAERDRTDPNRAARRVVTSPARLPANPPVPQSAAAFEDPDSGSELPHDVLVVVSKLKAYVKARSGMNTSDGVTEVLSNHLRNLCTAAIRSAAQNSRKTVLNRDFEAVLRGSVASE